MEKLVTWRGALGWWTVHLRSPWYIPVNSLSSPGDWSMICHSRPMIPQSWVGCGRFLYESGNCIPFALEPTFGWLCRFCGFRVPASRRRALYFYFKTFPTEMAVVSPNWDGWDGNSFKNRTYIICMVYGALNLQAIYNLRLSWQLVLLILRCRWDVYCLYAAGSSLWFPALKRHPPILISLLLLLTSSHYSSLNYHWCLLWN